MSHHPWPVLLLNQLAEVRLGRQRSPKNHSGPQMRPYLRAANVGWEGLRLEDVKEMNFTDAEMAVYALKPGDLLLGEASGSPGEVGKPALWAGELGECAFQNTLLRVRTESMQPKFLLHFFRHMALSGRFVAQSRGVGIYHLGRARLANWPTPRPPIDEQRRIVATLEEHLSDLQAAERTLGSAAGRSRALATSALWRLTHGLPDAAPVELADIAEVRLGRQRSPKNHSGTRMRPYLRAANVDWDMLRLEDINTMNFTEAEETIYALKPNDILLAEASGSPSEVGKSVLYRGTLEKVCFQNTLLRVRCHTGLPEFVQKYLLSEARSGRFRPEARGVGISHLGRARLATLKVELPPEAVQYEAVGRVNELLASVARVAQAMHVAHRRGDALHRAVLAAAFSGRLTGRSSDADVISELAEEPA